jgi:acyl-CoA synthetase (AMP-forming)/AMP-acid ligase II/acetyltransferase-like isoleucine patch superfamily enzyme/acyl carrier protein
MIFHPKTDNGSHRERIESLSVLLKAQAQIRPEGTAISAPGRTHLTYGRFLQQAETTVKALREFGVNRNDRVALVLPNGPELAASFVSVACGATCAPLNPSFKAQEFDFYLADLEARALIIGSGMDSPVREIARKRDIAIIELTPTVEAEAGVFSLAANPQGPADAERFAQPGDMALVLHTSGTTSRPKLVPLTHANICSSGRNIARTLALTENDRCLNVMPLFHIHGLIAAVVASLTAGGSVICTPGFDPDNFFSWLESSQPTWYTAVPTIHQSVLSRVPANREIIARRPLRFIRSSSAALPTPVLQELESSFQTQVIEAYGMTEASHQMASNPLAPSIRKPGSVGIAAGPEVAIMDETGRLLPVGEIGEVVIRGANVTSGYENNPSANQSAFTNGWFRTGDQGRLDEDGYLFLTGRLKEIINRGGDKIAPREVDEVLSQHPDIAQAVTFAVPHSTLGEDVAAAIVLKAHARTTASDIREFAAARLSDHKVPKQILIVEEIPKGPTGKLQRIGLAEKLAGRLACELENSFVAPRSAVEKEIAAIWSRILKTERVGIRDNFHTLGGDSLALATMLIEVHSRFGIDVPVDRFLRCPAIETIAQCLVEAESGRFQASPGTPAAERSSALVVRDSVWRGLRNRLLQYIALYVPGFKTTRVWLHRMRGVSIGTNVSIGLSVIIETAYPQLVSIGNNVSVGIRAVIIGHLRDSTTQARVTNQPTVRVEDDVYIGPGVIILPNVTIGKGAVVSAGSVVSRFVPPQTLVRGNPAEPVAHCGVSLGGGVSYEQFLNHLTPIQAHRPAEARRESSSASVDMGQTSYEQSGVAK